MKKYISFAFLYLHFQVIFFASKTSLHFQCLFCWSFKYFKIHFVCMFLTVWFVLQSFEAIFTVLWCRYLQKGDEMLSWQCSPLFLTFVSVYLVYIKETAVPQPRMISPGVIVSRLSFELCNLSRFDSVMLKDIFSQP